MTKLEDFTVCTLSLSESRGGNHYLHVTVTFLQLQKQNKLYDGGKVLKKVKPSIIHEQSIIKMYFLMFQTANPEDAISPEAVTLKSSAR